MNLDRNYLRDMHFATEVSSGRSFFEKKLVELRDSVLSNDLIFEGQQINDLFELDIVLSNNLSTFKGSVYEELKRDIINTENQISLSMPDKGVTFFIENATLEGKSEMLSWYCKPSVSTQGAVTFVDCKNMPFKEVSLDITFQWKQDKIEKILICFSNKESAEKSLRTIVTNDELLYDSWLNRQINTHRNFQWGLIKTNEEGISIEITKVDNTV